MAMYAKDINMQYRQLRVEAKKFEVFRTALTNFLAKNYNMSFIIPIYIWASIQSFLQGCIAMQYKNNKANWFLIGFLFLTSTNILFQYILRFTEVVNTHPQYVFVSDTIGLLYGPVLYLYYQQMIYQELSKKAILHFVPAIVFTLYFVVVEMGLKSPFHYDNYIGQAAHVITLNLILLSSFFYFLMCWIAIKRVRNGSKITEFKLIYWLEILLMVLILKTIFNVITFSLHTFLDAKTAEFLEMSKNVIFAVSNMVIIIGLQFFFSRYPYIINNLQDGDDNDDNEDDDELTEGQSTSNAESIDTSNDNKAKGTKTSGDKKEGFTIDEEEAQKYIAELEHLMATEKLYLDSELTEKDLAKALGVQPYFLSKLLNQHMGKRFNEYVNYQRVGKAKKLLTSANAKNYTMFAISVDSGFKSESVFYNNFKKYCGKTPKAYQQKYFSQNN